MWQKLKERLTSTQAVPESHATPGPDIPLGLDLQRYPGIEPLLDAGDIDAALRLVELADPDVAGHMRTRTELLLRREAFVRAAASPKPGTWPPRSDRQLDDADGLPEIMAGELDTEVVTAGVRNHGALIVRGLFSERACADLRQTIDAAEAAFVREPRELDPRYFMPLTDLSGAEVSAYFRSINWAGGRPVPDVPAAAEVILSEFRRAGVPDVVAGYLDERPAVSMEKWTLRKVAPDPNGSWHQDGAFLGADKHALNLWVALSDCGQTASGLDIVAKRFDEIVPVGTEGAYFEWDVSGQVVQQVRGERPIVSPVFATGDAIFFDHYLLHRTGLGSEFVDWRYALETWFFAASTLPDNYEGLLV